jgi:hypothetical protein
MVWTILHDAKFEWTRKRTPAEQKAAAAEEEGAEEVRPLPPKHAHTSKPTLGHAHNRRK